MMSPSQGYKIVHKFVSESINIDTTQSNFPSQIVNLGIASNLHLSGVGSNPFSSRTLNIAYPSIIGLTPTASGISNALLVTYIAEPWTFTAKNPFSLRDVIVQHVVFGTNTTTSTSIHGTHVFTFYPL